MSGADYRDVVIETLAESEAALHEQIAALAERAVRAEVDRDAYRLVAAQAIHYAHELQNEATALRDNYHRALDDARGLRVQLLQRAA